MLDSTAQFSTKHYKAYKETGKYGPLEGEKTQRELSPRDPRADLDTDLKHGPRDAQRARGGAEKGNDVWTKGTVNKDLGKGQQRGAKRGLKKCWWQHGALEMLIRSEVSQEEKDKCRMISLPCGISNMAQMNLPTQQRPTLRCGEQTCGRQGGRRWGRDGREFGAHRCKLSHLEWTSKEVLLYSTGNSIQSLGWTTMEDNMRKEMYIYVCVTESLGCTAETGTML